MVNATHTMPARARPVSHQTLARVNPRRIRVGHAVQLDGYTFMWDGSQFRSRRRERAAWAAYWRQGRMLLVATVLGTLMAWAVVYGLDWEVMTPEERAPYLWAGGGACVILLIGLWRFVRDSPRRHARETDHWLKTHLGITHRP